MKMADAIKELKSELEAGTSLQSAIQFICDEFDVLEYALKYRFEKAYGVLPENYKPELEPDDKGVLDRILAEVLKKHPPLKKYDTIRGRSFTFKGREWKFAAFLGRGKIVAIDAVTLEVKNLSGAYSAVRPLLDEII